MNTAANQGWPLRTYPESGITTSSFRHVVATCILLLSSNKQQPRAKRKDVHGLAEGLLMVGDWIATVDRRPNPSDGSQKWAKKLDWQAKIMRDEGLLMPATESPRDVWILTAAGKELLRRECVDWYEMGMTSHMRIRD